MNESILKLNYGRYYGVNILWQWLFSFRLPASGFRLPTTFMNFVKKQAERDEHLMKLERFLNELIQIRSNEITIFKPKLKRKKSREYFHLVGQPSSVKVNIIILNSMFDVLWLEFCENILSCRLYFMF